MKFLFLGDIVGDSGCIAVKKHLQTIIEKNKINFVIANGENAAIDGVGITENIVNELLSCGVDVITTGNHIWDQKETSKYIFELPLYILVLILVFAGFLLGLIFSFVKRILS